MSIGVSERLDALLQDASLTLARLAGGAAVCTFSRAGVPVPGIKYAEGRWAALREVQRSTSAGGDPVTAAASALSSWIGQLDSAVSRGQGRDWVAYRSGGVDALETLLDPPHEDP